MRNVLSDRRTQAERSQSIVVIADPILAILYVFKIPDTATSHAATIHRSQGILSQQPLLQQPTLLTRKRKADI